MQHSKKIILDRNLTTDAASTIYQQGEIFVFYDEKKTPKSVKNVTYIPTPVVEGALDVEFILKKIYELGIMSILVESGGKLNGAFLPYTDKIYNFIAPKIVGDNSAKSSFDYRKVFDINESEEFVLSDVVKFLPDILLILHRK